ncbi:ABC transporter FUM19 [Lachnellula suecica]|uniref:ABC transporter FUM19 n=1 Tax=Lachnellula suecica TaxID=602035 RepID=A0A8T9CF15_9HELO|nr:ABC transporter FUM19 [Lachnellula suecica]
MPFTAGDQSLLQMNQEDFDFNVQFEQLFFSILPSVLFIVTSLWRTVSQARKPNVVNAPVFQLIKLCAITTYVGLELSLLILVAVGSFHVTSMFTASSVLKLVSALFMITLSLVDHSRSPRPSVLLTSYLFLTLLLDAAQARTLFLSSGDKPELTYSSIFSAAIALKVGILLLEAQRKSRWVSWDEKEHSPEETSGIFSLGIFFWLNKLFLVGYKKVLAIKDLYPLDSSLNGQLLHQEFSKNMDYSKLKGDKFGLLKVLMRTLKVPLLLPIPPRLALLGFTFCQPFFIEKLLDHLSSLQIDPNVGYGFIGASVLIYSGIAVSTALYWYFHHRMRTMGRSILVTEIYIKATETRIGTGDDSAALTLMSTDIERINNGFHRLHDIWASIIQCALASWMLYSKLGVAFVAPIGLTVVCFGGLVTLMKFTGDSQRAWMAGVQKRVGLTATVITSMKNLKMSGLSTAVNDFVQNLRVEELAAGSRFRKIQLVAAFLGFVPLLISPPLAFAFAQRKLDTSRLFTSLSYLLLLTTPLSQIFQSVPELLAGVACLGRIQAFLECETRHDFRKILADMRLHSEKLPTDIVPSVDTELDSADPIIVKNGKFGWEPNHFALSDVNIRATKSSLTIVVGPVGSGKSTLCKALLGEIPFSEGSVFLSNRFPHIGFCDQTAILSNGSIKDTIVGFSSSNQERYNQVIDATGLGYDFDTLPQGDMTNVGSNGITLSGGQKQRVSLARALYLQTDLLILDDVLSGLDADTEERVFSQVFGPEGLLQRRQSTVVLCTHCIKHLPAADCIIALEGGTIVEQGSFDMLMSHKGYIQSLGLTSSEADVSSDKSTTKRTTEKSVAAPLPTATADLSSLAPNTDIRDKLEIRQYTSCILRAWAYSWQHGVCSSLLFGDSSSIFRLSVRLTFWTDDVYSAHPVHSHAFYAGIYALLQISAIISLFLLAIAIFIVSVERAGANIHLEALHTLIRAPLRFFTATDTGVIINLFSQDLNLIDTELPNALLNTLFGIFQVLGQGAVLLTSSPYMGISYPFLGVLLYFVQKFYLSTSRQLRLLDLEAKSPLYTHFLDTLKGITTLRAFGFIPDDIQKNARLIDTSQRPAYLLTMIQQWLSLVLDLMVMVLTTVLTTLAVRLHSSSGFTGAALVTLMSFGETISFIVIFYTKLETSIGAIARLKIFNESVKPEDRDEENIVPPEQWPQSGVIELTGVSASYDMQTQNAETPSLALRDINLTISSGEKIAICGRTGSGKSSLIALRLKLLDPLSGMAGNAVIDNTPLYRIDRQALRRRIIAVPQEDVFLPDGSTFHTNLDPLEVSTPEECQSVLVAVGLWKFIQDRGGLNAGMNAGTLSAGQRQLISLGRALLRRRIRAKQNLGIGGSGSEGGILLLDEVSSNVDHETEHVMQEIIRAEFRDYTIVAVSHRLDMIMDFDRVVVMDTGVIVEVGNPMMLAGEKGTRFGGVGEGCGKMGNVRSGHNRYHSR